MKEQGYIKYLKQPKLPDNLLLSIEHEVIILILFLQYQIMSFCMDDMLMQNIVLSSKIGFFIVSSSYKCMDCCLDNLYELSFF